MAIYRALRTLDTGKRIIEQGSVFPASWLKEKSITVLTEQDKIAPALLPPVFAMPPPWKQYAAKLKAIEITDAGEWMEADPKVIAKVLKVSVFKAEEMRASLFTMFSDPRRRG